MPFNAKGEWVVEDDSVAPRVASLVSSGSPLIEQARTRGLAAGNRRGLLNSSLAIGAAEGEAYKVAVPIASQEAQQTYGKNLSAMEQQGRLGSIRLEGELAAERQAADIAAEKERTGLLTTAEMERLREQGKITSEQQAAEIAAQRERQQLASQAEMERLAAAAGFDKERIGLENQGQSDRLRLQSELNRGQTQLEADINRQSQERQIAAQAAQLERTGELDAAARAADNRAQLERVAAQAGFDLTRQNAEFDRRLQELTLNLAGQDRERAGALAAQMFASQDQLLAGIFANDKIPADVRERMLNDNTARRQAALDLIGQLYDVDLDWGTGQTTPAPASIAPGSLPGSLGLLGGARGGRALA